MSGDYMCVSVVVKFFFLVMYLCVCFLSVSVHA